MKHAISSGIVAGTFGALAATVGEMLHGSGGNLIAAFAVAYGLMLPMGIVGSLQLVALRELLPLSLRPAALIEVARSADNVQATSAILTIGLGMLAMLPVYYRVILFFISGFHHPGLAATALTAVLLSATPLAVLLGIKINTLITGMLDWLPFRIARRPLFALVMVLLFSLLALVPPLWRGKDAVGLFGFVGLLVKDGLNTGPLFTLLIMVVSSLAALWGLLRNRASWQIAAAGIGVVLGLAGPVVAHRVLESHAGVMERLNTVGGITALAVKSFQKLRDRDKDGYSPWMGGRDCDDLNPKIHPTAQEVPDNGIDEDCSGDDIKIGKLMAAAHADGDDTTPNGVIKWKRPNLPGDVSLFLITIDSLRWDGVGFMGYTRPVSPNLDKLVENGVIYDRAYALGSYTGQAIPPMMTGKYASELLRNDQHETRISGRETFVAERICGDRVRCGAVLSHFLFKPFFGWHKGFHDWTVVDASPTGPGYIDSKYNSDRVADAAISWLKRPENTNGPFFLWTHFMDPHKEYLNHKGFKRFGDDRRSQYDQEVLYTDYHIGRMMDFFKTLPASGRTIVMVTADHGESFREHGRWCHGWELWDEIIRVPLAVTGPGIDKKRMARQTSQIDLFPTFLDIFGVEIPAAIHGRSLLADWVDGQTLPERPVIADQPKNPLYETRRVFIKDGWKLHDLPDSGGYRLYQLTKDYERGESLVESEPERFREIKAAYDLFLVTLFNSVDPVSYDTGNLDYMPLPKGYHSTKKVVSQ